MRKIQQKVSMIMPVYNGSSTLEEALKSLYKQNGYFDELIIINDGSKDGSLRIIKKYIDDKKNIILINNKRPKGLAAGYNQGIKKSTGDIIVTIHQDIILKSNALKLLLVSFRGDHSQDVVASTHTVLHPKKIWDKYNFWQKCFFSRMVGRKYSGIDGKFDAFRKESLKKVGYFDQKNFRTAGEDGDIWDKLKKVGKVVFSRAEIIHIHTADPAFGPKDIIKKQAQYSETQGVLLRRGKIKSIKSFVKSFLRELMLVLLVIPYICYIGLAVIIFYSFAYTWRVYLEEFRDSRIIFLPFLNVYLLFVSLMYSLSGFIKGRQTV